MSPNKEGLKKTEVGLTSASPYAAVGNPVFPYMCSVYGFWALALTSDSRASDSSDSRTLGLRTQSGDLPFSRKFAQYTGFGLLR